MADDAAAEEAPITFNVKSAQDAKHTVTLPTSSTVMQLKEKLAGSEYANIPPERQRLIYSGRVLKDTDTLGSYKIKEGHTIHLVKGAASNERQNPANQGTSTNNPTANPSVPTNISSGPGANNPLAGLTGARYAGLAHLPNQSMFGPDGGMGPPPDPEQILGLLENPQFASSVNEALSNPQVIETMIQQNPMLRDMGPEMRQMMQSPEFRRMMTDPQMLRSTIQMQRMMGGNAGPFGGRGNSAFPAPGATDTSPGAAEETQEAQRASQGMRTPVSNPFAFYNGSGAQPGNPFLPLFNPTSAGAGAPQTNPANPGGAPQSNTGTPAGTDNGQQVPPNIFGGRFQDPAMMAQLMAAMNAQNQQSGGAASSPPSDPNDPAVQASNPFASLMQGLQAGTAGPSPYAPWVPGSYANTIGQQAASPPPDTRPPEERYEEQLRQLNDMGFYEFERNVEALRRTGGSVQGAVEYLLTH